MPIIAGEYIPNTFNERFDMALASKLRGQRIDQNTKLEERANSNPYESPERTGRRVSAIEMAGGAGGPSFAEQAGLSAPQSAASQPRALFSQPAFRFSELSASSDPDEYPILNQYRQGYANGGEVMSADYELYRKAAADAGMPALPMQEAIPQMAQYRANQRAKLLQSIANGATTQGYAAGGAVNIDGAQVVGPGTGKSDSIPAVIDGVQPAALSNGEFHIPKHIVDYYGTKMLDALVEKARMAGKAKQRKGAINAT